ncbi:MAG TPA: EamA family transporter [Thermoanaerobaculia bacterium]|nr:EamA family transporter [Thermoanaerobaculia bacterium]
MKRDMVLAYIAFGIVCFVWGTTYLGIAIAIETLPTFLFAGSRFTIGGAILLILALLRGQKLPSRKSDWVNLAIIGALMVGVGNIAVVWAEHHMSSGFAALLVATSPLWMSTLETFRKTGERVNLRKGLGMLIGFGGVGVLVAPELEIGDLNTKLLLGVIALQLGSIAWNLGSIRSKYHLSRDLSPIVSAALQMMLGGVLVTAIGFALGESSQFYFSTRSLIAYLYLLIFGSVLAYGAYVYALSKLKTSTTSLYAYINPLVAVFLGWLVLSEPLGWNAFLAMAIIFSGVALVQTGQKSRVPAPQVTTAVIKPVEPDSVAL